MTDTKPPKHARRSPMSKGDKTPKKIASGPEITISQSPMGRSTLSDVEDDLRASPWPRAPLLTVSYNEVPLDSKRAREAAASCAGASQAPAPPPSPSPGGRAPIHSGPEIEVTETSVGRETMALLDEEDDRDDGRAEPSRAPETSREVRCDALELRTFVVPDDAISPKSSDAEKRAFVRDRLAHRLPCPIGQVRRIDAKVFEAGAVVLRVWCPVD